MEFAVTEGHCKGFGQCPQQRDARATFGTMEH